MACFGVPAVAVLLMATIAPLTRCSVRRTGGAWRTDVEAREARARRIRLKTSAGGRRKRMVAYDKLRAASHA